MHYRVNERYLLRGWEKLPYAVVDSREGAVSFVPKTHMATLMRCDGNWGFDNPLVSDQERSIARVLLEKGIIEECEPGDIISPRQQYLFHENRYMQSIHWCITGKCNYRCRHCSMSAPEGRYGELSLGALLDIARQLAECGVYTVNISGGEPLIRPDFFEIVAELSRQGIIVKQLYTNGLLLDGKILDGLEELDQHPGIVVSFDGVGHHDWLRGVRGAEEAVYRALALCTERGFATTVQMCLHRGNMGSLRETSNRLASLGCARLRVGRVSELGDWNVHGVGMTPTFEEYYDAVLRYIPEYYEDGMPLGLTLSGVFSASPEKPDRYLLAPCQTDAGAGGKLVFSCARHVMQLFPDGRPAICDTLGPDHVGMSPIASDDPDAETTTLADVLSTGSPYMELLDTRRGSFLERVSECNECEYLRVCGGGCRANAYNEHGSIMGADSAACAFFKGGWAKRVVDTMRAVRPEATFGMQDDDLFKG